MVVFANQGGDIEAQSEESVDRMEDIDSRMFPVDRTLRASTNGLVIDLLPRVSSDELDRTAFTPPSQLFKLAVAEGRSVAPQFIFLRQRLGHLCSYAPQVTRNHREDLRDGGGLGVSVELFFLTLARLLFTALSQDSHSALYIGTFRLITSDWRQYKDSTGTQRVILNLVLDVAVGRRGVFSDHYYPSYITDELLILLGNIIEGQSGSHIDDAVKEVDDQFWGWCEDKMFGRDASEVLSQLRAPISSP
ncbi:hypothetical protein H4582DRAFT_2071190 [Lactarius indigo]|nr:hypothetical protein H4582DRAFT_2071190 [Lactarius indigo]